MATKKKAIAKNNVTRIAIVLDASGSMGSMVNEVHKLYESTINEFKSNAKKFNQKFFISLYTFDDYVKTIFTNKPIEKIPPMQYQIGGMTALFDATGQSIEDLASQEISTDESFLLLVLTDGGENQSTRFNGKTLTNLIKEKYRQKRWTITFQVPPNGKGQLESMGIESDNIRVWDCTAAGMIQATAAMSQGIANYAAARSVGMKSVDTFYKDIDLSTLKAPTLKKELDDVTNDCVIHDVPKEDVIKEFYERKTKRSYSPGDAFYLLQKVEIVQPTKDIRIQDKNTGKVFGGDNVRSLIGIDDSANYKVDPFNVGPYNVFIESHSTNRKLPRGTKVLFIK